MRVVPFGEAALLVELSVDAERSVNLRVHALSAVLEGSSSVRSLIPGIASLLVEVDPLADLDAVAAYVRECAERIQAVSETRGRQRLIPVVFGGEHGPDLDEVSERVGMVPGDIVDRLTALDQSVYMVGFTPGFAYLGDLPAELALPRRATPRTRVPPGSLAIAGRHSGIYPRATPGGWHLLGASPVVLFDPHRDPPAYLRPGDRVQLFPIQPADWERYATQPNDW